MKEKNTMKDNNMNIMEQVILREGPEEKVRVNLANKYKDEYNELYAEMKKAAQNVKNGMAPAQSCQAAVSALQAHGFANCDYFMWCDPQTLKEVTDVTSQSRLMAAIWLGNTRLIDNDCFENLCSAQN